MSGARYLDDFRVGERWVSEPVTLTAEEIIAFGKANDPQPMHTDAERAVQGPFGSLVASGWQIAALSMHVFVQAGGYGETPVVGLGIDELRWLKPVRPGDCLVVEREIVEIRRSETRADRGVLRTRVVVRNQHDDIVMSLYTLSRVPACAGAASPGSPAEPLSGASMGAEPEDGAPGRVTRQIDVELPRWAKIIRTSGAKPE